MFSTAVTSDVCSSPTSEFRLTVLPFSTSSVILVTDNVTKAAPGWYSDGTNKAYWDGNVVSQFQACSVLSIVLNLSQAVACTLLLQDLLKLQSLYRLVLITALHGQTIQDLY
jgi:hypothetical protein